MKVISGSIARVVILNHRARVTTIEPPLDGIEALGASTASPQVRSLGKKL